MHGIPKILQGFKQFSKMSDVQLVDVPNTPIE